MTTKDEIHEALKEGMSHFLTYHHELYSSVRCKDVMLEELISKSLKKFGIANEWLYGSHNIVTDIVLQTNENVSIKSGVWNQKQNTLTFSGSRLGSYPTLEQKHAHIMETKPDFYIFGSKPVYPQNIEEHEYAFFVLTGEEINYSTPDQWVDGLAPSLHNENISAEIRPSMSHQLWTTVNMNSVENKVTKICIPIH